MKQLESGNTYKISQLFTDNRHIIIPDLQRDYCWGDKSHGDNNLELVTGFLDSMNEIFKTDKEIKLGMIYGYEYPTGSNRIYLCDGQQRITTLFLLLGMINKQKKNAAIENCLISEFELNDDQEPRLQYAIRESTLYFLSDLTCSFFLESHRIKTSEIKNQSWYFKEYDLDPSIQSMISAMEIIEQKLDTDDDLNLFADFLLNKIEFFYFDMNNRETGEDMFVVINTTGEPLTATENIKPLIIGNIKDETDRELASNLWEKWEKWFWEHKTDKEHEADNGLNKFFIFYWQIKLLQEKQWKSKKSFEINPFQMFLQKTTIEPNEESNTVIIAEELAKVKSIDEIEKYFLAYQNLHAEIKDESCNGKIIKSIANLDLHTPGFLRELPINVILPLIQFKVKYPQDSIYLFLRRLRKNFFDNKWECRKNNYVDWRHLIQLVDQSQSVEHLLTFSAGSNFKEISNVPNNVKNWFNSEEQSKLKLKDQDADFIESLEDHQDFMGDLSFLFSITEDPITIEKLAQYFDNYKNTIDLIRDKNELKPILSNYFRVFRLLIGCNEIGHIYRASWDFEGVVFSKIDNREHLKKKEFRELCACENSEEALISFCKKTVKKKIIEQNVFDLEGTHAEKLIKSWLVLKAVNAENHNVCLSYYDGNDTGVAAYKNRNTNKLLQDESFSLGNSICGFGVRSGFGAGNIVHYTQKWHWLSPKIIDTPFCSIEFDSSKRSKIQIEENNMLIEKLKKQILN
ncbi:DUF262 domain-containing protein [Flavobacterium aquiphilum]|uniref:DUF262 domain-containing protein n=1 Tax=Flavobacterium aquiphilum TaxID=3003261 RepID=UPI00248077E2|nr:DUF262 domain-containing protein [Flavobacterium aquiphilum]